MRGGQTQWLPSFKYATGRRRRVWRAIHFTWRRDLHYSCWQRCSKAAVAIINQIRVSAFGVIVEKEKRKLRNRRRIRTHPTAFVRPSLHVLLCTCNRVRRARARIPRTRSFARAAVSREIVAAAAAAVGSLAFAFYARPERNRAAKCACTYTVCNDNQPTGPYGFES